MKNLTTKLIFSLLLITIFSSCNEDSYKGNIAVVDDVAISNDLYAKQLDYYQKFYSKTYGDDYLNQEVERGKSRDDVIKKELVDSMIKDQVMLNDLNNNNVKVDDAKATNMRHYLEDKLGGKDSLKANMNAIGLTENQFNEYLYLDSIRKMHYEYYLANNDIKDKDILDYYKQNKKYQKMYKYNVLVFDDEHEARKLKDRLNKSNDFRKALKNPVRNYSVINSDFVYVDDELLNQSAMKNKDQISDVFNYEDKYMILMINSYNENENELLINLKDIYLRESYDDYLNKLTKKSKIRLFI